MYHTDAVYIKHCLVVSLPSSLFIFAALQPKIDIEIRLLYKLVFGRAYIGHEVGRQSEIAKVGFHRLCLYAEYKELGQ